MSLPVTTKGKVCGFLRPTPENHAFRAVHHLAGGADVTPESKGFIIKDECDISAKTGPVLDQGQIGDCVDNGCVEAMWSALAAYGLAAVAFSRFFLYAMVRIAIGVPLTEDSGSSVTDGIVALMRAGVCPESVWPSTDPDGWTTEPSQAAKDAALKHRATRCYSLSNVAWIKACLSLGFPVVFGVQLPNSFDDIGSDGFMPLPDIGEDDSERGHCMLIVGYRKRADGKVDFKVKNSWSTQFGEGGYCWMGEEFVELDIAMDFWTIHEEKLAA